MRLDLSVVALLLVGVLAAALVSAARGDRQTAATRLNLADELEASGTRDLSSAMAAYRWNRQPARPKSWYLSAADNPADADDWMSVAQRTSGSWWSDWAEWSVEHADELTSPPPIGSATYPVLGPGPGTYVFT